MSTPRRGREYLHEVSLALHAGEIVAIAGVSGNGRGGAGQLAVRHHRGRNREHRPERWPLPARPNSWYDWVSHESRRTGMPSASLETCRCGRTPCRSDCHRPRFRAADGYAVPAREHARAPSSPASTCAVAASTPLRAHSLAATCRSLILGRALTPPAGASPARLIVAHQPTWGLDIGAVAVQDQLIAARDAGAAVLLISDDLDEVMALGDRIAVMHAGELTDARSHDDWTREPSRAGDGGAKHAA